MDIKITKEDYIKYLTSYLERDRKFLNVYMNALKKADGYEAIMYLEEIQKVANNLSQNIHIMETTHIHKTGLEFFIDTESGNPLRVYPIDDKGVLTNARNKLEQSQASDFKKVQNTMFG